MNESRQLKILSTLKEDPLIVWGNKLHQQIELRTRHDLIVHDFLFEEIKKILDKKYNKVEYFKKRIVKINIDNNSYSILIERSNYLNEYTWLPYNKIDEITIK